MLAVTAHGRMVVAAASANAEQQGAMSGMAVADVRALIPGLQVFDEQPGMALRLLTALAKWCIRYTPVAAIDQPDGLILDISGCAHLWGGEELYLKEIVTRIRSHGYRIRAAMADTPGAAWAIARYGKEEPIIKSGEQASALMSLPPVALRLEEATLQRLQKLGLYQVKSFIAMPRASLRRRFGPGMLLRIDQALGWENEVIIPVEPTPIYQERLHCLEPIMTRIGIEIALERLLETLCNSLRQKGMGLRTAVLKACRVDGKTEQVEIGTNRASHNATHLFKLFENKINSIEPALGIELFILEAPKVEILEAPQEALWNSGLSLESMALAELIDRITNKLGTNVIHRYLPAQHYWPERSIQKANALQEKPAIEWSNQVPRPVQLLHKPDPIEVSAPIPDYPPMLFRYKGKLHRIKRADGPERIECEWWLEQGQHRDYYMVEDEEGQRYWVFRLGHYTGEASDGWFIHGFFA